MKQKKKRNSIQKDVIALLPIMIALCLIPFVILTKDYQTNFSQYNWFTETELDQIDSFESAKGSCVAVMGFIAMAVIAIHEYMQSKKKKRILENCDFKICILCAVYFIMVILSSVMSKYSDLAYEGGGYGQWQTMWVLLGYALLFLYAYIFINSEKRITLLFRTLIVSTGIIALIGVLQTIGNNPLRWSWVQKIITSQSKITELGFKEGYAEVILTFNNPNYVGPYIALLLPIVVAFVTTAFAKNKTATWLWRLAGTVVAAGLVVSLVGAGSSAGMIAVFSGVVFAAVLLLSGIMTKENGKTKDAAANEENEKRPVRKYAIAGASVLVVLAVVFAVSKTTLFQNTLNKILQGGNDTRNVASIVSHAEELKVTLRNGSEFLLVPILEQNQNITYQAYDEQNKQIPIEWSQERDGLILKDERFQALTLKNVNFSVGENVYPGFRFNDTPNDISWIFMNVKNEWMYYTPFGKFTKLREIEHFGFENYQNIANRRGFIWSRTIPLMKDYWFRGIGPNAFIIAFPNDDFVGSKRVGGSTTLVDKPHNTFLQVYVQTGGISALAYVGLWLLYMIDSIKVFWRKRCHAGIEKIGLGIATGIFAFTIASLTNDGIVGTQVLYWTLLGTGYAVNRTIKAVRGVL